MTRGLENHPESFVREPRSRERAALDIAVEALRTVTTAGYISAQQAAHAALRKIKTICPEAVK